MSGFWDASTYYALANPTTDNINSTFTCEIDNGTVKIGEPRFKDVAGVRRTYIFFRDGSSKPIEDFFGYFLMTSVIFFVLILETRLIPGLKQKTTEH